MSGAPPGRATGRGRGRGAAGRGRGRGRGVTPGASQAAATQSAAAAAPQPASAQAARPPAQAQAAPPAQAQAAPPAQVQSARPPAQAHVPQQQQQRQQQPPARAPPRAHDTEEDGLAKQMSNMKILPVKRDAAVLDEPVAAPRFHIPNEGPFRMLGQKAAEKCYVMAEKKDPEKRVGKLNAKAEQIQLFANSFLLRLGRGGTDEYVYNYRVTCNEVLPRTVVCACVHEDPVITSRIGKIAFDGVQAFLLRRLEDDRTEFQIMTKGNSAKGIEPMPVTVTFEFNHMVPWRSPTMIQVLNILLKNYMKSAGMTLIGRQYFNPKLKKDHGKIQVWPGYATAISECTGGVLMNVDISHKVTRKENARDVLTALRRSGQAIKEAAEKQLVGEVVMTRYNNKTYRIDDIDWAATIDSEFETGKRLNDKFEKCKISYREYYRTQYGIDLKDTSPGMLVSINKQKGPIPKNNPEAEVATKPVIYLVPELCDLTGISESQRSDFQFMRTLADITRTKPHERAGRTTEFTKELNDNPQHHRFDSWGISIERQMVKPLARRFKPISIFQYVDWDKRAKGKQVSFDDKNPDWTTSLRNMQLARTPSGGIKNWVLFFNDKVASTAKDFHDTLIKVAGPMNLIIDPARAIRLSSQGERNSTYTDAIQRHMAEFKNCQLVVVLLPNNNKPRYDAIKKLCYVHMAVASQCVVARTLNGKKMMSATTKIAMQINVKLGGALWHPEPHVYFANTMTMGLDVFHQKGANSIAGMVASMNQVQDTFYSKAIIQCEREENMSKLQYPCEQALDAYVNANKKLPRFITIFRDGVGDGQLNLVRHNEVAQIEAACDEAVKKYPNLAVGSGKIGVLFVVVGKRINHRFYQPDGNPANPIYKNPLPGTVVDTVVTRAKWFDYFLCSQSAGQGTAQPTHFNVIYDSTQHEVSGSSPVQYQYGVAAEEIQRYSYIQTHLYYNWPGTVRVPAHCQYAHKLAYMVGEHLVAEPNRGLDGHLYYL